MASVDEERDGEDADLDARIAALYGGPLAAFVAERDGLARALRAEGRRDEAATVKALRKPKVVAWALDAAVHSEPGLAGDLAAAVEHLGREQATGGDVRGAIARVRDAEGAVADAAARTAGEHGNPVHAPAVALALRAVVGDDEAFASLRAVRLVDVPAPGGLLGAGPLPDASGATSRAARPARRSEGSARRRDGGDAAADRATTKVPTTRRASKETATPGRAAEGAASPAARMARRAVAAATKEVKAAEAKARKAGVDADMAARTAEHAEDTAKAARRRADEAREAADAARRNADELAARLRAAEETLAAAEDDLRGLEA
jgi:hypothetical protein